MARFDSLIHWKIQQVHKISKQIDSNTKAIKLLVHTSTEQPQIKTSIHMEKGASNQHPLRYLLYFREE